MRVMPYTEDSYVHVIKRGGRGLAIVTSNYDRLRFRRLLFHMNDAYADDAWESDTSRIAPFERPAHWPPRKPLVTVLAYTLLTNHFHLLLKARSDGSISTFMRRVCGSMSKYYNATHETSGSIFQGAYKGVTIVDDVQLQYTRAYIEVKNVFELYPKGVKLAAINFPDAWEWAVQYPWSSLGARVAGTDMPELSPLPQELDRSVSEYKKFAKEVIRGKYLPDHVATKDV